MAGTEDQRLTPCTVVSLGMVDYREAWDLQRTIAQEVAGGSHPDTLILLEHPHVYTLGRRGKDTDILLTTERLAELGVQVHSVDRGGEVTYHGPGQLVAYPILNLRAYLGGPLKYVRALEQAILATLSEFGIEAECGDRPIGIWVGDAKIAAIGVRVSRGVTTHGLALNVDPDLSYFDHIVPCGMRDTRVTSMSAVLGRTIGVSQVAPVLARHLGRLCGWQIQWVETVTEDVTA